MTSFNFEIDEKSRAGSEFVARVANEIRRALVAEKQSRKLTQQAIAEKIGTSRAVVNREVSGLENLSARRIGELLWAIGWEPHFEAKKPASLPHANHLHLVTDGGEQPFILQTSTAFPSNSESGQPIILVKVGASAA